MKLECARDVWLCFVVGVVVVCVCICVSDSVQCACVYIQCVWCVFLSWFVDVCLVCCKICVFPYDVSLCVCDCARYGFVCVVRCWCLSVFECVLI